MTRNFTLRLPPDLANALDALRPAGMSQHSYRDQRSDEDTESFGTPALITAGLYMQPG